MRVPLAFALGLVTGLLATAFGRPEVARAQTPTTAPAPTVRSDATDLRPLLPFQGHAMADAESHFAKVWFAAEKRNWTLAGFFLNQTLSSLRWAVRIRPVRPVKEGEIDLQAILEAIESSALSDLRRAIVDQSPKAFDAAYRTTLETCNACHRSAERAFLRVRMPGTPGEGLLDLEAETPAGGAGR